MPKDLSWNNEGPRFQTMLMKRLLFQTILFFSLVFSNHVVAAQSQSRRPDSAQIPYAASPTALPKRAPLPSDDFAGLNFTDDQKTKIDEIHRKMNLNRAIVAKAENLTADAKDAMIQGYSRIERTQLFEALTPEQKKEVLQRIHARQEAPQAKKGQVAPPLK